MSKQPSSSSSFTSSSNNNNNNNKIRISIDGSRNYDSQYVDQNQFCTTYNKSRKEVEDIINFVAIHPLDEMIIRTVTLDRSDKKPLYHCYNIESLYKWVIVDNHKFDPSTKGVFDDNSIDQINKKYWRYQNKKQRLDAKAQDLKLRL